MQSSLHPHAPHPPTCLGCALICCVLWDVMLGLQHGNVRLIPLVAVQTAADVSASIEGTAASIAEQTPQVAEIVSAKIESGAKEVEKQVRLGMCHVLLWLGSHVGVWVAKAGDCTQCAAIDSMCVCAHKLCLRQGSLRPPAQCCSVKCRFQHNLL